MRERTAVAIVAAILFALRAPGVITTSSTAGLVGSVAGLAVGAILVGLILVRGWRRVRGGSG
jgi:hypothetical protein